MTERSLMLALAGLTLLLGLIVVARIVVVALIAILAADALVVGLFFLVLLLLPLWGLRQLLRDDRPRVTAAAPSEERRRLMARDRTFRRILHREAARAADLVASRAAREEGDAAELVHQTRQTLDGLAEEAADSVGEADSLQTEPISPGDLRDLERYDDLLLAGIRRVREEAIGGVGADRVEAARELLDLAHSAERHFALRQDLVLRGRRLPQASPLHLLRPDTVQRPPAAPEWLRPGGAVSRGPRDYLVTAHVTYFEAGRTWHALVLRGEEGERRLQVEQRAGQVLFMAPAATSRISGRTVAVGTASASIDSLSGSAEEVVVDYRRTQGEGGVVGWWERWPEGDRAFTGEEANLDEFQFWPAAVGSSSGRAE